jgi:hypothetical protein
VSESDESEPKRSGGGRTTRNVVVIFALAEAILLAWVIVRSLSR